MNNKLRGLCILIMLIMLCFSGWFMDKIYGYSVPLHPSGKPCLSIGSIGSLTTSFQPAGTIYYINLLHPLTVHLPSAVAIAFDVAFYDNDGTPFTHYEFSLSGTDTFSNTIKTGQNRWSEFFTIAGADTMALLPPKNHNSTWICFRYSANITPTPTPIVPTETMTPTVTATIVQTSPTPTPTSTETSTLTNTPTPTPTSTGTVTATPIIDTPTSTPTSTAVADIPGDIGINATVKVGPPTNLEPVAEPDVQSAQVTTATINVRVYNDGLLDASNVHVTGSDGLDYTLTSLKHGQEYDFSYDHLMVSGTNAITYEVTSNSPDKNLLNNKYTLIVEAFSYHSMLPIVVR